MIRHVSGYVSSSANARSMRATRVVFAGSRPLGALALELLARVCRATRRELVGVITDPPGYRGWWSGGGVTEVSQVAQSLKVPQIDATQLDSVRHDMLISVYCSTIFSAEALSLAPLNVNLHSAPLPEYRGCHTYSHAILRREAEYGTSLHVMTAAIDAGPIIDVDRFPIRSGDTARTLYDRTTRRSAALLRRWIPRILEGAFDPVPQQEIVAQRGVAPRYFDLSSLEPYIAEPAKTLTAAECDRRRRALTFPPRFMPPAWLDRMPVAAEPPP